MVSEVEALYICIPTQTFQNTADLHEYALDQYFFFNFIRWTELFDKNNMTFVNCYDKILLSSSWKKVIKLTTCSLNNIIQDSFSKVLSEQLTHDRSYISHNSFVCLTKSIFKSMAM